MRVCTTFWWPQFKVVKYSTETNTSNQTVRNLEIIETNVEVLRFWKAATTIPLSAQISKFDGKYAT